EDPAARLGRHPGGVEHVLHRHRDADEGAVVALSDGLGGPFGGGEGGVGADDRGGVDALSGTVDPLEEGGDHVGGGEVPAAVPGGELVDVEGEEFGGGSHRRRIVPAGSGPSARDLR